MCGMGRGPNFCQCPDKILLNEIELLFNNNLLLFFKKTPSYFHAAWKSAKMVGRRGRMFG